MIQENKHRLNFIKEKLNYNIDRKDALSYLKKTYAEYTAGVSCSEDMQTDEGQIKDVNSVDRNCRYKRNI